MTVYGLDVISPWWSGERSTIWVPGPRCGGNRSFYVSDRSWLSGLFCRSVATALIFSVLGNNVASQGHITLVLLPSLFSSVQDGRIARGAWPFHCLFTALIILLSFSSSVQHGVIARGLALSLCIIEHV